MITVHLAAWLPVFVEHAVEFRKSVQKRWQYSQFCFLANLVRTDDTNLKHTIPPTHLSDIRACAHEFNARGASTTRGYICATEVDGPLTIDSIFLLSPS